MKRVMRLPRGRALRPEAVGAGGGVVALPSGRPIRGERRQRRRLVLLAGLAAFLGPATREGHAQWEWKRPPPPPDPTTNAVGPWPFTLEVGTAGVFDTNIENDLEELDSYGIVAGVKAGFQTSIRRPLLEVAYEGGYQSFAHTDRWDRMTHDLEADLARRAGPVSLELRGRMGLNTRTEDREIGNRYSVSPRLTIGRGHARLRLYGLYRARRFEPDEGSDETTRGLGGAFRGVTDGATLQFGYRYEEADSESELRRYVQHRASADYRVPLGLRSGFRGNLEWRPRRYLERTVSLDDDEVARRDARWTATASLTHEFRWGQGLRLDYSFQRRTSNDPEQEYDAHRVSLGTQIRLIGPKRRPRREPGDR